MAFWFLKDVIPYAPILATTNFGKTFIVEFDAFGQGIWVVFMQEGTPLDFESKQLKGKYLMKSTYKREMAGILHAIKKWRQYLIGRHFKFKTNHDSLK